MCQYLIIGPSWIGDMVMANALFRWLKFRDPACSIDVLAPLWSHSLLARMPEVRHALVMPIPHGGLKLLARYRIATSLRNANYDQAILLPNSFKSALIPAWAGIAKRTGWRGEWRYGLLNDLRRLDKSQHALMVQRYLALGVDDGKLDYRNWLPRLTVDAAARSLTLKKYSISSNRPLLILCPGAQYGASKRWPAAYFAKVAGYYLQRDWQVALLGGAGEKQLVANINASLCVPGLDLTATTLAEAIDILSLAQAVVSNDSGLMHIACALGRKVIAIYGSSSPDFTPPLSPTAIILSASLPCKPCFKRECPLQHLHCLQKITPQEVIQCIESEKKPA